MTRTMSEAFVGSVPANSPRKTRKSVLVCPRCGHENTVEGDWIITPTSDHVEVACPVCYEVLTVRPHCSHPERFDVDARSSQACPADD